MDFILFFCLSEYEITKARHAMESILSDDKEMLLVVVHLAHYVVDRARENSTTRYSPEAPAEGLYQVGLFTSALSDLYHGYFF